MGSRPTATMSGSSPVSGLSPLSGLSPVSGGAAADPPAGAGAPLRRLWLVRHGESEWNAGGLVQGQQDPGLSDLGREQAAHCAGELARARPASTAVWSSDLRRALETAAPIGRALALGVKVDPGLRERSLGVAEGTSSLSLRPECSGVAGGMVVDADAAPAGGESVRQLYERAVRCALRILSGHSGDVVLVCHGGVIRILLAWLDGVGPDGMAWPEVENGVPVVRSLPAVEAVRPEEDPTTSQRAPTSQRATEDA